VCNPGEVVTTNGHAYLQLPGFGKIVEAGWYRSFEIREELVMSYGFPGDIRDLSIRHRYKRQYGKWYLTNLTDLSF
jgi:hypothetical protein